MQKPALYLDIVGTLLIDRNGELIRADYASRFIEAVRGRFDIRFLTSLEEHHAHAVAKGFGVDVRYVAYRRALGKASAIDFKESFYWIDDDPAPSDLLRLADERCSDRLIPVNRRDGVNEATLKKLLATADEHAAAKH